MACGRFCGSAARIHVLHAYRNAGMTSASISLIVAPSPRAMLLSVHIGFSFVSAAVVYAILATISDFDSSPVTNEPRYLKLDIQCSLCPFCTDLLGDAVDVSHQRGVVSLDRGRGGTVRWKTFAGLPSLRHQST